MIIKQLQKLTTIDYPNKLACTIFISGCNFRCSYCHNPELVLKHNDVKIKEEEILSFLEQRKDLLEGVCFTGGEPLLTLEIPFLEKIKKLGYKIKIDTNGSYPKKLQKLIDLDLVDYIAMDVKTTKEKYEEFCETSIDIKSLNESINIISDFPNYEFRTTLVPYHHAVDDVKKIRDWLVKESGKKKLKAYYLQSFVARKGSMVGDVYNDTPMPSENVLEIMKGLIKDSFEICEIRS